MGAKFAPQPAAVTTVVVRAQTWQPVLSAVGSMKAVNGVMLSTDLAGIVAEIAFGIEASVSREKNMQRFLSALPSFAVWPFDQEAAFRYGLLAAELRRTGRPMQVVDIMVGAIALNLGDCKVITTDSDLLSIPGLTVEKW